MDNFKIYFKSFLSIIKQVLIGIAICVGIACCIKLLIWSISTIPFITITGIILGVISVFSFLEYKKRKIEIEQLMFRADDLIWQISSYEQALSELSINPEKNAKDIEYYKQSLKEDADELIDIKNKIHKMGGDI